MAFKFRVLFLLAAIHGMAIADETCPEAFVLAGDQVVSSSSEGASEVTLSGNARLTCDLVSRGRLSIKADKLLVRVPTDSQDAATVPEFVADSNCHLDADDLEIKSSRMVATNESNGKSLSIKLSGDIEIRFKETHISASTAILTHSQGRWKVEQLKLKRFREQPIAHGAAGRAVW